jgi:hypothetical protein
MGNTLSASESFLQSWNCANCGRINKTAVALDGFAQCEYCADTARVRTFVPWLPRLAGFATRLFSSFVGEFGCIQWQTVLVQARTPRVVRLTR